MRQLTHYLRNHAWAFMLMISSITSTVQALPDPDGKAPLVRPSTTTIRVTAAHRQDYQRDAAFGVTNQKHRGMLFAALDTRNVAVRGNRCTAIGIGRRLSRIEDSGVEPVGKLYTN